jgi:MFS family permease
MLRHSFLDIGPLRSSLRFRRLWIGRGCSGVGSQLTMVAVLFQVWRMTHSTVWSGAVGLAQAVPMVALGLFAGSALDRGDRRRIYVLALVGQMACSALLAVQGFTGHVPVLAVLALVAGQSCCSAAGGPAVRTFVPALLPPGQVPAGLALNQVSGQVTLLVGPALGGLVLGWSGVGGCYMLDVLSFGLAFYGAFGLPPMPPGGTRSRPGLRGVADGLAFLVRNPTVRGALVTDLAATVLSMPVALLPLVNSQRFGGDPRTLGLFLSSVAVGGMVASTFSGAFTRLARPGVVMLCGSAGWGVAITLFGIAPNRWLGFGCMALAGAADTLAVVSRSTIIQLSTPNELLGRVVAAELIVGQAGPNIGNLRGGLLADATSGTTSLVTGGLMCVAAVLAVAVGTSPLRKLSTAPPPPPKPRPPNKPPPDRRPAPRGRRRTWP